MRGLETRINIINIFLYRYLPMPVFSINRKASILTPPLRIFHMHKKRNSGFLLHSCPTMTDQTGCDEKQPPSSAIANWGNMLNRVHLTDTTPMDVEVETPKLYPWMPDQFDARILPRRNFRFFLRFVNPGPVTAATLEKHQIKHKQKLIPDWHTLPSLFHNLVCVYTYLFI